MVEAVHHLRLELDDVHHRFTAVDQLLDPPNRRVAVDATVAFAAEAVDHLAVPEEQDRVDSWTQNADESGVAALAQGCDDPVEGQEAGAQRFVQRRSTGHQERVVAGVVRALFQLSHINHQYQNPP